MKTSMARDQHGQYYHDLGPHPRKELLQRLGRKHADKVYQDMKDGSTKHVGWIIAGLWLRVYWVTPMNNAA